MSKIKKQQRIYLEECREEFNSAKEGDDDKQLALTQAYLAYAEIQIKRTKEGIKNFEQSIVIAENSKDVHLKVKILGIQILSFQLIGRLPDAFKAAQEIESIAVELGDLSMKCEALVSQGQVQIDSGDPVQANDKYEKALEIAKTLEDKHSLMNVLGALGNYSLTMASIDKAYEYFKEAKELAILLKNKKSEIGYLGNQGTILEWKKDFVNADKDFYEVWSYFKEIKDEDAEIRALHHLVLVNSKLNNLEKVIEYCDRGIELTEDDKLTGLYFHENSIFTYYKMNRPDEAHAATKIAIESARSINNKDKMLEFLLSLGESYMLYEKPEEALTIYEKALELTQRLQKLVDRAYLMGRIGIVYAELGKTVEAINHHEQSVLIAKENSLTVLEAEQLTMLAMAYDDLDKKDQAIVYCNMAIDLYNEKEMEEEKVKVRQLLTSIKA